MRDAKLDGMDTGPRRSELVGLGLVLAVGAAALAWRAGPVIDWVRSGVLRDADGVMEFAALGVVIVSVVALVSRREVARQRGVQWMLGITGAVLLALVLWAARR